MLVDDHRIFREGLKALIESDSQYQIVAQANHGVEAVELAQEYLPEVAIIDVAMPQLNGIDATKRLLLKYPKMKIIALTMHSNRVFIEEMFRAGASAYLHKQCPFLELMQAIDKVIAGETYLSSDFDNIEIGDIVENEYSSASSVHAILTRRECEILQLLAEGNMTKEIAMSRNISVKTVEAHRQNIMKKLKINNLAGLTRFAIKQGLTTLDV